MGYLLDNLLPGETLIHETREHGTVFFWPVVVLLLGLAGVAASFAVADWLLWVGLALLALGVLLFIPRYVDWRTTELGVTDQRVIAKTGFIQRRSLEMVLQGVESIGVDQAVLARILNYGTVTISGTGGTQETFRGIAEPFVFRRHVNEQIAKTKGRG